MQEIIDLESMNLTELNNLRMRLHTAIHNREKSVFNRNHAMYELTEVHGFERDEAQIIILDAEENGESYFISRKKKFPCADMLVVDDDGKYFLSFSK